MLHRQIVGRDNKVEKMTIFVANGESTGIFCEDTGRCTCRHCCKEYTQSQDRFAQRQETADDINDRRNDNKSVNCVFHNCPVPEVFEIDICKDHSNDHHRHCRITVSDSSHRTDRVLAGLEVL